MGKVWSLGIFKEKEPFTIFQGASGVWPEYKTDIKENEKISISFWKVIYTIAGKRIFRILFS